MSLLVAALLLAALACVTSTASAGASPAITGKVVSKQTGIAIPGATTRLYVSSVSKPTVPLPPSPFPTLFAPWPSSVVATDTAGRYTIGSPVFAEPDPYDHSVTVCTYAPGFALRCLDDLRGSWSPGTVGLPLADLDGSDLETIELPAGSTVSGRVVDAAGAAVPDATVDIVKQLDPTSGMTTLVHTLRVDAGGNYELALDNDATKYSVCASAPELAQTCLGGSTSSFEESTDWLSLASPGDRQLADIVLRRSIVFTVRVVDTEGNPVPGGYLNACRVIPGTGSSPDTCEHFTPVGVGSGSPGERSFSLRESEDAYSLGVTVDGGLFTWLGGTFSFDDPATVRFTTSDPADHDLGEIVVPVATTFSGAVEDEAGSPIANAAVAVYIESEPGGCSNVKSVTTDPSGHYAIELRGGSANYKLRASAPGYAARWLGGTVDSGDPATRSFTVSDPADHNLGSLTLPVGTQLSGTVSIGGSPSYEFSPFDDAVSLMRWDGGKWVETDYDRAAISPDGQFSFGDAIGDGTYTARFSIYDVGSGDEVIRYLDGGASLPSAPTTGNSFTLTAPGDRVINATLDIGGGGPGSTDTTKPTIGAISPASGYATTDSSVAVTYTASDDSGERPTCTPSSGSSVALASIGANLVTIKCQDAAGNIASASVTYTRTAPGRPKLESLPKSIDHKKQVALKLTCTEGCIVKLSIRIGKKGKVKTFKTVALSAGTTAYKFKLPKSVVKQIDRARGKSKKTKVQLLVAVLKTKHDTAKNSVGNIR